MTHRKRKIISFLLVSIWACNFVCMAEIIDDKLQEGTNFIDVLKQALGAYY